MESKMIDYNFEFKATKEDNETFLKEIEAIKSFHDSRFSRTTNFSYEFIILKIIVKKYQIEKESARAWLHMENNKTKEFLQITFSVNDLCSFLSLDELVNNALKYFRENKAENYRNFFEGIN